MTIGFRFLYLYAQDEIANGGSIQGTITNRFGEGVLATNVICRDTSAVENAVSWVSGAELQGNGAFTCGLLPNGDYEVEVSPIETAINIWEDNPPFIATEYYSGTDESFDPDVDDRDGAADVSVSGSAINNINIVLNEDGRLQNNVTVVSSIVAGTPFDSSVIPSIHDLEYFFFVPSNARTVTFTLEANDTNDDIDLLVRCGSPFSLATGIVGPLYDQSDPANDQSDVVGVTTSGLETIELTSSSSPSIQECEYHLVLVNYTDEVVGFELTATIMGNQPKVILDFTAQNQLQDNGETLVASLTAIAKGDRFVIDDITFTDEGKVGAGNATAAKLYRDDNENGQIDDSDTLLGQTTQISNGEFTITGVNMYLLDDERQEFLVTYDLNNAAGPQWWMWLLILGIVLSGIFVAPKSSLKILFIISMLASGISCSSGGSSDYNIKILQKSDVVATALGFGDAFSIENDAVQSVQDFFAN
ncbi:MAG: hypothetical protein R3A45_03960 [Bdellovibrionota bacterium]